MDKKLVVQSGFSLLANGLPALFGLITFRLLSGILGVEEFGYYILLLAGFGIYTQIRSGIITAAFVKLTAGKQDIEHTLSASVWISILLSFIFMAIALVYSALINSFRTDLLILSLLAFTTIPSFIAINLSSSKGKFQRVALIRLMETGSFLIAILFLNKHETNLMNVLWMYALTSVLVSAFILLMKWSPIRLRGSSEYMSDVRAIWSFGKFTSGTQLVTSLLTNTDVFIINYFLGSGSVALYEYGRKWLEIFEVPFRSLAGVYFTEVSSLMNSNRRGEIWNFILSRSIRTSLLSLLLLPVVYFLAPVLIEIISGDQLPESITVFRILMLLVLFIPFDRFLGLSLDVIGFPNLNFLKGLILLGTNFILDIVVIHMGYGILGVAFVSIIFYGLGTCLSFYWLKKKSIQIIA